MIKRRNHMKMWSRVLGIIWVLLLCCPDDLCTQSYAHLSTDSTNVKGDGPYYGLLASANFKTERYGLVDTTGKIVVPHVYYYLRPAGEKLWLAINQQGYHGFLDTLGTVQIPLEYSTALLFKNGKNIVSKDLVFGVIDQNNETLIPFKYNVLVTNDHTTYMFQLEPKKTGLMNALGEVLIEPTYVGMLSENDSLWIAMTMNEKFEIFKNNGQKHVDMVFDHIGMYKPNKKMRTIRKDGKVGFLNEHFQLIIPPMYDKVGRALGDLFPIWNGEKWGFINADNEVVIPYRYDNVKFITNNLSRVSIDGKQNILNNKGELLLEEGVRSIQKIDESSLYLINGFLYDRNFNKVNEDAVSLDEGFGGSTFFNGYLRLRSNKKLGFVDTAGQWRIPSIYDISNRLVFSVDGVTAMQKDGLWKIIDTNHVQLSPVEYDSIYTPGGKFESDVFMIKKDEKWGVFSDREILFEPQFDEIIENYSDNFGYRVGDKYGILDSKNGKALQAEYDSIAPDLLGFTVMKDGKYGFVDEDSLKLIIPTEYSYLENRGYYFIARKGGSYGTISYENELLESFRFDFIGGGGYQDVLRTKKNGKFGTLSTEGRELLPPIYDEIQYVDWDNIEVRQGDQKEILKKAVLEGKLRDKN